MLTWPWTSPTPWQLPCTLKSGWTNLDRPTLDIIGPAATKAKRLATSGAIGMTSGRLQADMARQCSTLVSSPSDQHGSDRFAKIRSHERNGHGRRQCVRSRSCSHCTCRQGKRPQPMRDRASDGTPHFGTRVIFCAGSAIQQWRPRADEVFIAAPKSPCCSRSAYTGATSHGHRSDML
jgi:hypothetical protein